MEQMTKDHDPKFLVDTARPCLALVIGLALLLMTAWLLRTTPPQFE